jgi:hypothetical protein
MQRLEVSGAVRHIGGKGLIYQSFSFKSPESLKDAVSVTVSKYYCVCAFHITNRTFDLNYNFG